VRDPGSQQIAAAQPAASTEGPRVLEALRGEGGEEVEALATARAERLDRVGQARLLIAPLDGPPLRIDRLESGRALDDDAHAGAEVQTLRAENARLQADNTELRARLMSTEETNRLLLASQATLREAVTDYQSSIAEVLAGLDGYRQAADGYRDSAEHFHRGVTALQASNAKLNTVLDHYSDALSQHTTPAHPGDLRADGGGI